MQIKPTELADIQPSPDSIELDDALFARMMDHSDDPAIRPPEPVVAAPPVPVVRSAPVIAPPPVLVRWMDPRVSQWRDHPTLFPRH